MKILPNIPRGGLNIKLFHPQIFQPKNGLIIKMFTLPEVGDRIAIKIGERYVYYKIASPRLAIHDITNPDDMSYNFNLQEEAAQ